MPNWNEKDQDLSPGSAVHLPGQAILEALETQLLCHVRTVLAMSPWTVGLLH